MPVSDTQLKAEEWIRRIAWIGKHDDPCAVASEAAGLMRVLLDELNAWIEQAEKSRKIAVHEAQDGAQRVDRAESQRDELLSQQTELIALQKKWRRSHENEEDYYYNGLWEACADELAAVIKVTVT